LKKIVKFLILGFLGVTLQMGRFQTILAEVT